MGNSVIEEVKKVFVTRKIPEVINRTHMALIPKIQGPKTLGNYKHKLVQYGIQDRD